MESSENFALSIHNVKIIVPNSKYYKKFVKYCLDKNREDIY